MKVLGYVVSDKKKIFENCILKTYFLTLWPTYATNWNSVNHFCRGPPRNHFCKVWSKSKKGFQRRCLKKLLIDGRTDRRTMDEGQWAITKAYLDHLCSGELKISQHCAARNAYLRYSSGWILKNLRQWAQFSYRSFLMFMADPSFQWPWDQRLQMAYCLSLMFMENT